MNGVSMRVVNCAVGVAVVCGALATVGLAWTAGPGEPEPYAHDPLMIREGRPWLVTDGEPLPLDDVSAFCIECHGPDGAAGQSHAIGHEESSHPIGVAYPAADPEYRADDELDAAILLTDGRITCLSCHAWEAPDHRPVLPVAGGDLCQACHLL